MRMAGHMGNKQVTVRNLEVFEADPARNLLLLKGAVPGMRNSRMFLSGWRFSGLRVWAERQTRIA